MGESIRLEYRQRPSALATMARALRGSPGFGRRLPAITARWRGHRAQPRELADFLDLSGLPAGGELHLLYPHTMSFPLQMAILTHPAFPVPIWRVLQIRNHLLQHRPLGRGEAFDMTVTTAGYRILEKGAEVDLYTAVSAEGGTAWEGVSTFFVRGRYGAAQVPSPWAASPAGGERLVDQWRMPRGGGRRFGRLSGDYNGLHLWGWYARRLGFARAFFHPQRVLGQCLARVPASAGSRTQRLDAWLKGPVFYDASVALRARDEEQGTAFALHVEGDPRPAIIGHLRPVAPGSRLREGD